MPPYVAVGRFRKASIDLATYKIERIFCRRCMVLNLLSERFRSAMMSLRLQAGAYETQAVTYTRKIEHDFMKIRSLSSGSLQKSRRRRQQEGLSSDLWRLPNIRKYLCFAIIVTENLDLLPLGRSTLS